MRVKTGSTFFQNTTAMTASETEDQMMSGSGGKKIAMPSGTSPPPAAASSGSSRTIRTSDPQPARSGRAPAGGDRAAVRGRLAGDRPGVPDRRRADLGPQRDHRLLALGLDLALGVL